MSTAPAAASTSTKPPDSILDRKPPRERTPWLLGFTCLLMLALPTYVVLPGPLKSNGSPARMIAVLMFGLAVLGFLCARRQQPAPRLNPGAMVLVIYLFLWLVAYGVGLLTYRPETTPERTRALVALITHVGIGLFVFTTVRTARQRKIVLGCLLAGLAFVCLIGVLQGYFSVDLRHLFMPPGFVLNADDEELADRLGALRVVGTSQHAIEFSVLAAAAVPLAIYFARHADTRNVRFLSAAACGVALLALPAAISRTGIVSLAGMLLIYMFAFKVRQIAFAVAAGVLAIVSYIAFSPRIAVALWNTITGSAEDESIRGRTEDYAIVSQIFHEHPVFGLGLGGAPTFFDNQWLQAIVQGGFVGLVAMTIFSVGAIFGMAAALRRATTPREREQAYMLGAVTLGILLSTTTFDLLWYQQATSMLFIGFALLWGPSTIPVSARPDSTNDGFYR